MSTVRRTVVVLARAWRDDDGDVRGVVLRDDGGPTEVVCHSVEELCRVLCAAMSSLADVDPG